MTVKYNWLGYKVEDVMFLAKMYPVLIVDGDKQLIITKGETESADEGRREEASK